jgi:predicted RNA-binding protein
MCEFKVILGEEEIFIDVIYVKVEDEKIFLRDVLGESKEVIDCHIREIDVTSNTITLIRKG